MSILFTKPIESLTQDDVGTLIGWPESLTVEFKKELSGRDGRADAWLTGVKVERYATDKLFKEVVAFANTSGGHLVLGIDETKDAPPAAASITPVPRCVDLAERLMHAAQSIDPPVPLLLVWGIPIDGDAGVVVFRVPASRAAPHRAPDKECYVRRGTSSVPMSMREIQDMTLAVGRREERTDNRFRKAADRFAACLALDGEARGVGFRITAIPLGGDFSLGRLYGRTGLVELREWHKILVNGHPVNVEAVHVPRHDRPIIRGVRYTLGREEDDSYLDLYSNGCIEFGFKTVQLDSWNAICISWFVGHLVNVLQAAMALRQAAGSPDGEYGIEAEIRGTPLGAKFAVSGWSERATATNIIGQPVEVPLMLPRLSFGPSSEFDGIVTMMVNDLCDGLGAHYTPPWRLNVVSDPPNR